MTMRRRFAVAAAVFGAVAATSGVAIAAEVTSTVPMGPAPHGAGAAVNALRDEASSTSIDVTATYREIGRQHAQRTGAGSDRGGGRHVVGAPPRKDARSAPLLAVRSVSVSAPRIRSIA